MAKSGSFNILVIDDEPLHRSLLRNVFEERGYKVQTARGSRDALVAMERRIPDLVLLDISLGTENGYAVARVLRARCGDGLWILALTARGEHDRKRAEAAGFDDWLTKPFDVESLVSTVRHYLEERPADQTSSAPAGTPSGVLRSLPAMFLLSVAMLRGHAPGASEAE